MSIKRIILVLGLLFSNLVIFAQWDTAFYQHSNYRIDDVWIFDNDNFLVAGDYNGSGHIYSTYDGGESYYVYTFDNWIRRLFFINDSVGYAGGTDNYGIYKTYDKGRTWEFIESETFFGDIHYMYFFSEDIGHVEFRWTFDGGKTWVDGLTWVFNVLRISDSVAYGCTTWPDDGIVKTEDMGVSWEFVKDSLRVFDLIYVDDDHYIAMEYGGNLLHSYDSFESFQDTSNIPGNSLGGLYIDFADSLNGFAATYQSSGISKSRLYATQDGGYHWYQTDLLYGSLVGKDPVICLEDQTFVTTYNTLFKSKEGTLGPQEELDPPKPVSQSSIMIPVSEFLARDIDIKSDSLGNIYLACTFEGQVEIGDTVINHPYKGSLLFAKLDSDYNVLWMHTYGSTNYSSIPYDLEIFPGGNSVMHLQLYGEYYIDSEGPFSGGRFLTHYNKEGEVINQIQMEGWCDNLVLSSNEISKIFLSGYFGGSHLSVGTDSITVDQGSFILVWDINNNDIILKTVAEHFYPLYISHQNSLGYDKRNECLYLGCFYKDSVLIDGEYYFSPHQSAFFNRWPSYYILKLNENATILDIDPNYLSSRLDNGRPVVDHFYTHDGEYGFLGVMKDTIYFNEIYYPPFLGERSFYISIDENGEKSEIQFLGGEPGGYYARQAISFQDYTIFNARQSFKTQFGNDMTCNIASIYEDDVIFTFFNEDGNYDGYYQLIDHEYKALLHVTDDKLYLGGASDGPKVEFNNETLYNDGEAFYYITELELQYLRVDEIDNMLNPLIRVYPNPSSGRLVVTVPDELDEGSLEIFNLEGQLIQSLEYFKEREIELTINAPPGIYIIKLTSKHNSASAKVVIKGNR